MRSEARWNDDVDRADAERFRCVTTALLTDHERLDTWQRAMDLLVESYAIAKLLPTEERYGLASQLRRAAVSVAANIAEGCGLTSRGDRLRFLAIARGSLCELRTLISAVEVLHYAEGSCLIRARELLDQTGQLLSGLRRYLSTRQ